MHPNTIVSRRTKKYVTNRKIASRRAPVEVANFLRRSDNSTQLPGKKDNAGGKTCLALTDTLGNLYKKRPRCMKTIEWARCRQCLCQQHANMALHLLAVNTLPKSCDAAPEMDEEAINDKLVQIPDANISFRKWQRINVAFGERTISKVKLVVQRDTFIAEFKEDLAKLRCHASRVTTQYEEIRRLRSRMVPLKECSIQMDYPENYSCCYQADISAMYYDRNQISIHPMVIHCQDGDHLQHLTEEKQHTIPTTMAFITALQPWLHQLLPNLQTIHDVTDSPSSQYRNKTVTALLAYHQELFNTSASWQWLETGHGKGPCDGVGGAVKKMAENAVQKGAIISEADFFCHYFDSADSKI